MVYQIFEDDRTGDSAYSIVKLHRLGMGFNSDWKALQKYLCDWNTTLAHVGTQLDDGIKLSLFHNQVRKNKAMEYVLNQWNFMAKHDENRTYSWLHEKAEIVVRQAQIDEQRYGGGTKDKEKTAKEKAKAEKEKKK